MNVGAETETDYGYYFQWGDTVDKSETNCSWPTYKHCNGSQTTLTKYNTSTDYGENTDDKTTLDLEDDAARAHMGGDWRIPTKAEIQEMLDNTNSEWIANYNDSGVSGTKFTSKTNGNSIFIPLSGHRGGPSTYDKGIYGQLWSSSLDDSFPLHTWGIFCSSRGGSLGGGLGRSDGLTVRGVCE